MSKSANQIKFNCDQVFSEMEIAHNAAPLLKKHCHGKILDVGAGSGAMSNYVRDKGDVTCLDFSEKLLERIKAKGLKTCAHDLNKYPYPFPDSSFDTVMMLHVLEHLISPYLALEEINRILKKNGTFILATPNTSDLSFFTKPEPAHYYHFNFRGLKLMLDNMGFKVIKHYTNVPFSSKLAGIWNLLPIKNLWEGIYIICEKTGNKKEYGDSIIY